MTTFAGFRLTSIAALLFCAGCASSNCYRVMRGWDDEATGNCYFDSLARARWANDRGIRSGVQRDPTDKNHAVSWHRDSDGMYRWLGSHTIMGGGANVFERDDLRGVMPNVVE